METVADFTFLGSKITADGDCSHELEECLLLGRKFMTNLDIILRRGGKTTQKNCTKKDLHDLDNHDGVITHLEPDILECEVKWALGSITVNKASGGDGIPAESEGESRSVVSDSL